MEGSSRLRASWRLLGLLVLTALAAAVLIGLLPVGALAPSWRRRGVAWAFRRWARATARLLGVRVEVSGPAPEAPFLLVCNHLSYLDVVVLESVLPCLFVAKADVRSWPVVGLLCELAGTIFIDRTAARDIPRVIGEVETALGRGHGVILFPEGTSTGGVGVGEFKPPLLAIAARLARPVHHAALSYRTPRERPPARLAVCWWGDMTFAPHVFTLLGIATITATVRFGEQPLPPGDRKRLAQELHAAVAASFTPVEQEPSPPPP